jgi:glycerophosphoryl diester phosphodiesterase
VNGRPLVLGHRGASRRARENTLDAFATARALGADGVELDVRRTADGVAVVNHDPQVEGHGLLVERSFAELRAAHPEVPTLDEALDALAGLIVNVEIKCLPWEPDADADGVVLRLVVDALVARNAFDRTIVSSFDLGVLAPLRDLDARIVTAWLTSRQPVEQTAPAAAERGASWLHPDVGVVRDDAERAVAAVHEHGLRVDVWTVNEEADIRVLATAGVDAIVTDVPDVALAVIGRAAG